MRPDYFNELNRALRQAQGTVQFIKITSVFVLLCWASTSFGGEFPHTLEDGRGHTITLSASPQRIVSQTLATDEMLLAICPLSRIVGFSTLSVDAHYSLIAEAVRNSGKARPASVEHLLRLQPDLILTASYNRAETLQQLQAGGATVMQFAHFDSLDNIFTNLRLLGRAIDAQAPAEQLIADMQQRINTWQTCRASGTAKVRALVLDTWHYTRGTQTTADDLLRLAGLENIAAQQGVTGVEKLDTERLLRWQPDLLIVPEHPAQFAAARQHFLNDPLLSATPAGQHSRLIFLDKRYFEAVSHLVAQGFVQLMQALYPDCQPVK